MNIVLIEDENIASRRLASLITSLAPDFTIVAQLTSVAQAVQWFDVHPMPDLIFLDIQLNDGYGFDIMDTLEHHAPIIFTTAYSEYAIRGFKYNGLDYLLKPIDKKELANALTKFRKLRPKPNASPLVDLEEYTTIKKFLTKSYKRRFMIKVGNQFNTFDVADIAYFKAEEGIIFLYPKIGQRYPIEYSLDQLETILDPVHFFRINRKYMVSVHAVSEIHTYFNSRLLLKILPVTNEQVIVARERTTNFKKWLDL